MNLGVYILVQVERGEPWQIAAKISKIDGVKTAHTVTGQYDIIVYAELADLETLKSAVKKVQTIEGVQHTQTAVCIP
jgi:DNA-binding Lrp family transcriptional regulator